MSRPDAPAGGRRSIRPVTQRGTRLLDGVVECGSDTGVLGLHGSHQGRGGRGHRRTTADTDEDPGRGRHPEAGVRRKARQRCGRGSPHSGARIRDPQKIREDNFDYGLQRVLDGLEARLGRTGG